MYYGRYSYEPVNVYDRVKRIYALTLAMHSAMYGVAETHDSDFALEAISDDGQLHELSHMIVELINKDDLEQIRDWHEEAYTSTVSKEV